MRRVDSDSTLTRSIRRLDGPPSNLAALVEFVEVQFGSNRRLVPGHRDRGLSDSFRRMQARWLTGQREAVWFGALATSGEPGGVAIVTRPGVTWSNRSFAGGPATSELALAFTDRTRTVGLREFTLGILRDLEPAFFPLRVYGYALSQAVGYWARCAPAMGAVAAHNVLGVPCWIWLDASLVGSNLKEPTDVAKVVRAFRARYFSGPAIDPCVMRSVGRVRAYDSPLARVVRDAQGTLHPLSVTPELAAQHYERVDAAFRELPPQMKDNITQHFSRLGLLGSGRLTTARFWARFAPTVLLEDRTPLWPMLDRYTTVGQLKNVPAPPGTSYR